ncbi:hypothetical protein CcaverHIS641_0507130 [Cutaneotrichosporon cavernicola]|nr:hypothetical protein CcaverHIS641_0507130 [Cutaneotrichosporon cavernicola]
MSSPSKPSALPTQPPGSPKKEKAAPAPAKEKADKADKKPNAKADKAARRAAKLATRPPQPPEAPAQQAGSAAPTTAQAAGNPAGPSRHRRAVAAAEAASTRPAAPPNPAQQYFSHLPLPRDAGTPAAFESGKIHPLVVRLGVLIASGTLRGASARTMAVLEAFREVVHDYVCPEDAVFWKDLNSHISPMIAYLETCRPKGVGVGNAIRWFKGEITRLGENETDATETAQKAALSAAIDVYIRDRIVVAGQVISDNAREKIKPDDVIVVYARSSVVERALLDAIDEMKAKDRNASFSVVVVDSRPLQEGRELLATLTAGGIPCTYTLLPLAATAISRASLVLLGGSSLNSDGALHSRAGTAVVAMLAKEYRVPVVACVETFKLSERVALDDLANNELGAAHDLFSIPTAPALQLPEPLPKSLSTLTLLYDLTPPEHITAVCTEVGFIPPSSVPTLLGKSAITA